MLFKISRYPTGISTGNFLVNFTSNTQLMVRTKFMRVFEDSFRVAGSRSSVGDIILIDQSHSDLIPMCDIPALSPRIGIDQVTYNKLQLPSDGWL